MNQASEFEVFETLKNGLKVKFRAITPNDKAAIAEAFSRLDPSSVYTRFFQARGALSDQELTAATHVDFQTVVALVVTMESSGKETVIGGGRYLTVDPASAEVAFLVEEDYHGLGIAGRLLHHLARIAREKGVTTFQADVLARNSAMLTVFQRSKFPMTQTQEDGVLHVTLSLAGAHNASG